MNLASELLRENLLKSIQAKYSFIERPEQINLFQDAAEIIVNSYKSGGRLYIAGNGGSAADAQHLAAEFVSKLSKDREPLPAEALTVDSSILTAIGNDYGYEKIFSRQILGKMTNKDVFLAFTTSGNSKNIISALEQCKKMDIPSVVFSGKDGGMAKQLADFCIVASGDTTASIQELHIIFAHTLCEYVERSLF